MNIGAWVVLAARNLLRNRRRSIVAGLAILLGVLAVTTLRGMLNGVQRSLKMEAITGQVGALQVHKTGWMAQIFGAPIDLDFPVDTAMLTRIEAVDNVRAAAPRIPFAGLVSSGDTTTFAMLTALDPERETKVCPARPERLTSGRLPSDKEPDGLVLSAELARRIGARLAKGDAGRVAILSNDRDGSLNALDTQLIGLNGLPRSPGLETRLGLLTLAKAQELLRMPGKATEIAISVNDLGDIEGTRQRLQAALGSGFEVSIWSELAKVVADAIAIQDKVLGVIMAVMLVVALLGVVNTLLMSVLERTREIGLLLALGLRRSQIVGLFVLESILLAVAASVPGLLGAGLTLIVLARVDVTFQAPGGGMLHIQPELFMSDVAIVLGAVWLGAVLAALLPARRASLLRPVQALAAV